MAISVDKVVLFETVQYDGLCAIEEPADSAKGREGGMEGGRGKRDGRGERYREREREESKMQGWGGETAREKRDRESKGEREQGEGRRDTKDNGLCRLIRLMLVLILYFQA